MDLDIGAIGSTASRTASDSEDEAPLIGTDASRAAEDAFNREQQTLNDAFNADRENPGDPTKLSSYHQFRVSNQDPDSVFRPGGELKTSTEFKAGQGVLPAGIPPTFRLEGHQTGQPSHYSSMTPSAESARKFAGMFGRDQTFVTDPQPHGRYLNGIGYSDPDAPPEETGLWARMARRAGDLRNRLVGGTERTDTPYAVPEGYMRQNEVSVPGSVPTEAVRGVLPYDKANRRHDYENYRRNPEYRSLQDYKDEDR